MPYTAMENDIATKLTLIAKRSIQYPQEKFTSLQHLLNSEYLMECYQELKKDKAAGVDGKTKEDYTEAEIKQEIENLIARMKSKKYECAKQSRIYPAG